MGTAQQVLTLVIAFFVPLFNGLVTKYGASKVRVYGQIILAALNGFVVEWLDAVLTADPAFDIWHALYGTMLALAVQLASVAGVWKPLGTADRVKQVGSSEAEIHAVRAEKARRINAV